MLVTYLNSASVLIQDNDVKILCDPWLDGEEYFGSWGIYPPYKFKPEKFEDIDFIYISHIHPDHCSASTLSKLNKNIPILIHNFPEKFLKNKLENIGFSVIELEHNLRLRLKDNLYLNILAADNCNPEICGKLMGCALLEKNYGTTQIDTMAVFDNNDQVIVNTNDCPYAIAENTAWQVKLQYKKIDFLLVGYVKASSYPQCFDLNESEKKIEAELKQEKKLQTAINYVEFLEPKYFMPFAGRYTLTGKNIEINQYRGEPELEYAYEYLKEKISPEKSQCIVLNHDCSFDISTGKPSAPFVPVNFSEKEKYIKDIFSKISYEYEKESIPSTDELISLLPKSYENFEKIRKKINWNSETKILLRLEDDLYACISCNGDGYKLLKKDESNSIPKKLYMDVDARLLKWLLQGPRSAHWSLADIGCHIHYKRIPNTYERGLYYCWNNFYSNQYLSNAQTTKIVEAN